MSSLCPAFEESLRMPPSLRLAWLLAGAVPAHPSSLEAVLADSHGAEVRLSSFRGKPLILFFEDRESAEQNAGLKTALRERAAARRLATAAHVVGVANVASYDFWPARGFVLSAVRELERRESVQLLLDWKRALSEPPLGLPDGRSSVVLLDASGHLVEAWSGAVEGEARERFFSVLARLVETNGPPAESL
jgi:hypothetical protein